VCFHTNLLRSAHASREIFFRVLQVKQARFIPSGSCREFRGGVPPAGSAVRICFHAVRRSDHADVVPTPIDREAILTAVRAALAEDVGSGDVTTLAAVPAESQSNALMRAREPMVVAGLDFAVAAFRELSAELKIAASKADGDRAQPGEVLLAINGPTRAILTAERVALNFVQRLSGVATATAQYVEAIRWTRAQILDTRKTTPGWRSFEKYAVACGGGRNHRRGLYDMVLIKDNHLAAMSGARPNPIAVAVLRARTQYPQLEVEVEADTLEQVGQAAEAGADFILLDNMPPAQLRAAVGLVAGRAKTEASGGVNMQTVRAIAESGVDFISVGAITHSARAVDIGLDFEA
jgi:nicotinate-nucleotide pyrophosphorylase (carboxylating)